MRTEISTQFGLFEAEWREQDIRTLQSQTVAHESEVIQYEVLS
ncbi:hypothetical protein [Staphylococcus coagulans]|nr:hypothetical protein [Staphylococcus coagulans]